MPFVLSRRILGLIALLSLFAFLFALFSQHVLNMQPCAWCILQRMICLVIAALAGLGWWTARRTSQLRLTSVVVLALALAGMLAAWYQHTVAANLFSCDRTFAEIMVSASRLDVLAPSVFGIYATCADSAVDLLGVRYELWTFALFAIIAAASLVALVKAEVFTPSASPRHAATVRKKYHQ